MRGWKLCCPVVWLTDLWNKLRSRLCKLRIGQYLFGQRAGSLGTDVRWLGDSFSSDYARFRLEVDHVVERRQFRSAMWLLAIAAWVFSNWNLSVPSQTSETLHRVHFLELPTVYPPTSQFVFTIASWLAPANASVELRLRVMKSAILLFDIATVLLLWRVLVLRQMHPAWTICYAWSPLVLKEFANSGHLDAITVCLALASILWLLSGCGRWLSLMHVLVSSGLAGLAIGGKLYPILLFLLIIVYLLRQYDGRKTLLWLVGAALSTGLALAPMLSATQAIQADDPSIGPTIQASSPHGTSVDSNASGLSGLSTFLTRWEMNDLLFIIVEENLRPANTVANQPPLWFAFVPNKTRVELNEFVATKIGLDGERVPFLLARFVTLCVFFLIGLQPSRHWTPSRANKAGTGLRNDQIDVSHDLSDCQYSLSACRIFLDCFLTPSPSSSRTPRLQPSPDSNSLAVVKAFAGEDFRDALLYTQGPCVGLLCPSKVEEVSPLSPRR